MQCVDNNAVIQITQKFCEWRKGSDDIAKIGWQLIVALFSYF